MEKPMEKIPTLTREETEQFLKRKLGSDENLAKWALVQLYECQTDAERQAGSNIDYNGQPKRNIRHGVMMEKPCLTRMGDFVNVELVCRSITNHQQVLTMLSDP